jgi:RNA polymerase sigma-70 factor (ECF subfamily)
MPDVFELEELYDEHAQALYAYCFELTRSDADTKDVLQDLFTKLSRQPKVLKGVRNVRAYLLRLVHNAAIDLMRRRETREKYVQEMSKNSPQIFEVSDDAVEEMFRRALSSALAELPEEQRAAVHLRLWEGMKFEEIAELLGISLNTAASRYRYAIDKLRQRLRPLYNEIR